MFVVGAAVAGFSTIGWLIIFPAPFDPMIVVVLFSFEIVYELFRE